MATALNDFCFFLVAWFVVVQFSPRHGEVAEFHARQATKRRDAQCAPVQVKDPGMNQ
ncbi:MAG: hypothetical protein LBV29_09450 [Azoarcus sp.]|nr:hypothetical protein [Azoarcus sp.]